ncbi:hypothetical protein AYI70_g3928 [Smittium culicis]|uniref:Zonadhesin n=1 Tax=Smittium culicis TaxID=133412 RepID=A0A1R1Y1B3_9FUNG|nr:hypothetical protein AYI70_g3928 [Smittium culicis]
MALIGIYLLPIFSSLITGSAIDRNRPKPNIIDAYHEYNTNMNLGHDSGVYFSGEKIDLNINSDKPELLEKRNFIQEQNNQVNRDTDYEPFIDSENYGGLNKNSINSNQFINNPDVSDNNNISDQAIINNKQNIEQEILVNNNDNINQIQNYQAGIGKGSEVGRREIPRVQASVFEENQVEYVARTIKKKSTKLYTEYNPNAEKDVNLNSGKTQIILNQKQLNKSSSPSSTEISEPVSVVEVLETVYLTKVESVINTKYLENKTIYTSVRPSVDNIRIVQDTLVTKSDDIQGVTITKCDEEIKTTCIQLQEYCSLKKAAKLYSIYTRCNTSTDSTSIITSTNGKSRSEEVVTPTSSIILSTVTPPTTTLSKKKTRFTTKVKYTTIISLVTKSGCVTKSKIMSSVNSYTLSTVTPTSIDRISTTEKGKSDSCGCNTNHTTSLLLYTSPTPFTSTRSLSQDSTNAKSSSELTVTSHETRPTQTRSKRTRKSDTCEIYTLSGPSICITSTPTNKASVASSTELVTSSETSYTFKITSTTKFTDLTTAKSSEPPIYATSSAVISSTMSPSDTDVTTVYVVRCTTTPSSTVTLSERNIFTY